jgi:hypothetical protein
LHSDIRTANPLNTPAGCLSRPLQTTTVNNSAGEPIKQRGSPQNKCPKSINLLPNGIPDAMFRSDPIPTTISEHTNAISEAIPNSNSEAIPKSIPKAIPQAISKANPECNSDHSHCSALHQVGGFRQWLCEAVGEHLSSRYVAQVDLSDSRHICSKIVLGRNVYNCSSTVDCVLDAGNE